MPVNQVLEWNQIFIDTLVATNTANSSSQRLGAIVHTAIFDAYNGIERRYTPIFVNGTAPHGSSRRAAVIAAAYSAIVGVFPSLSPLQREALDARYAASLAALSDDGGDGGQSRERGIAWGMEVAQAVLSWRATDGFSPPPSPPFTGGLAVGQWRPTGGSCVAMTALGLAFTSPFVVASTTQFDPGPPRGLASPTYADDFNSVKALGQNTSSQRSDEQTRPCAVLGGQRQRALESGSEPDCTRQPPVDLGEQSASRGVEHRHGRHRVHDLEREAALRPGFDRGHLAAGYGDLDWRKPTAIRTRPPPRAGCRSSIRRATPNIPPATRVRTERRRPCFSATSPITKRSR